MGLEPPPSRPPRPCRGSTSASPRRRTSTPWSTSTPRFGHPREEARPWLAPRVGAGGFTVTLASLGGEPAATAYSVRTDGPAGPSLLLAGVAVAEPLRRRGIGGAVSSWLLERGFAAGARLAHLQADTEAAALVYVRLGFADAGVLEVFTEV